jgi:hypothetical protein
MSAAAMNGRLSGAVQGNRLFSKTKHAAEDDDAVFCGSFPGVSEIIGDRRR